jgi:voltage-gated potassium channel
MPVIILTLYGVLYVISFKKNSMKTIIAERRKLLASIQRLLEGPMIFLGFVWLVLLVVELIAGLSKGLEYLSLTIWFIFIVDFF